MTSISFSAKSPRQFRDALREIVNSDFRDDARKIEHDDNLRNGILRHTFRANGRTMGYEAQINSRGDLVITDIQVLSGRNQSRRPRPLKTMDEIRAEVEAYSFVKQFRGYK